MFVKPVQVKPDIDLWLDLFQGVGVAPNGTPYKWPSPEPWYTLADLLNHAYRARASRVIIVHPMDREFFMEQVPGFDHGVHHLNPTTPTYRYTRENWITEIRTAEEWFGSGPIDVRDGYRAWHLLDSLLKNSGREPVSLRRSPGATGLEMWISTMRGQVPEPLDNDLQELIRSWSPQHRIQIFPPAVETMPECHIVDGRFMYAALTRDLGTGPVTWLKAADAEHLARTQPYARARYYVRYKAPKDWGKVSIFMAKRADGISWDWPRAGETWADAAEVALAVKHGWTLEFHEAIVFTKANPLGTWSDRLIRARERAAALDEPESVKRLLSAALRSILLHGIGSFHSTGRQETTVTESPMIRPEGEGWEAPENMPNGSAIWRRKSTVLAKRQAQTRHPEFSSQIWGKAHASILHQHRGDAGYGGLLHTPDEHIVAIYGDGIMLTHMPDWAKQDDGRVGRLRAKGSILTPQAWPRTERERALLIRKAE